MVRLVITKCSGNWDSSVGVAIIVKTENRAELNVPSNACKTDDLRASKMLPSYGPFSNILYHPQSIVFLAGRSYRYILLISVQSKVTRWVRYYKLIHAVRSTFDREDYVQNIPDTCKTQRLTKTWKSVKTCLSISFEVLYVISYRKGTLGCWWQTAR